MSTFKDAQEFKAWKKKTNYKPINEGFLDDDEDKTPTDSLTVGDTVEDTPDEEDVAELTGREEAPVETDGDDKPDGKQEEPAKEENDGVAESNADVLASIKDMLSNLNTSIQTMNDTIAKQADKEKEEDSASKDDEFADLDLSDSDSENDTENAGEDAGNDSGDDSDSGDDNNTDDNSNDTGDEGTEGSDDNSDNGGSEDNSEDNEKGESDEEYSGDDEHNDQKSEAYNQNMKRGKILNSNSHSLVGILESEKYWKLDNDLDTLIHLKLREKIEKAKSTFRQHMLESVLDDED